MPDAADRAAFSEVQEFVLAPAEKCHQLLASQACALIKIRQRTAFGELVPRANKLAIVAAIDAVAHQRSKVQRDRPGMLNRQIRDASPRVQQARRKDGLRRANFDAGAATAAVLGYRFTVRQFKIDINLTQEKHRSRLAVQHQGVFAAPALAAARGQLSLQHGG